LSESPDVARRYAAAEQKLEADRQRSIARGPIGLLGVLIVLSLAVGIVAAIDLRNLRTPRGTALAWTSAAVFGDCEAYRRLSVPSDRVPEGGRSDDEVCDALRAQTAEARENSASIGFEVLDITEIGRDARAQLRIRRGDRTQQIVLILLRRDDGYVVVRTPQVCAVVGCP
jgi:hypothetical protein